MNQEPLRYNDIAPTVEARMTLAEKVGQLVQTTPFVMPDRGADRALRGSDARVQFRDSLTGLTGFTG